MKLTKLELLLCTSIIALFFCAPAFYNAFPILSPNSSSYIYTGFNNHVRGFRPWVYSDFIRYVSLWETLWLVVSVQGLLIAGVIYLIFKEFYKGKNKRKLFYAQPLLGL